MPIVPVRDYDGARYPTLDDVLAERRAFLRQVGLSAIAAAFGPAALACKAEGSIDTKPIPTTQSRQASPTPPPMPAGLPVPPRWPGPRGALVGGRSIEVTYADGSKGWVAVAAVFSSENAALEGALIDAESKIAAAVRERLKEQPPAFFGDRRRVENVEATLLDSIKRIVSVSGLQSVAIARVYGSAAPAEERAAPAAPAARAVVVAPPAAPVPMPTSAPPAPRHLPRAGAKCPIHGSGCTASEHGS